ncbi:MAG: PorV/PorQ family protein [Candidatus Latescibacteria bacterium]|nr:PorV/PorQ family protein [Candidatus Latescibacterota bacterium]
MHRHPVFSSLVTRHSSLSFSAFLLLLVPGLAVPADASDRAGTAAFAFVKITPGARQAGMGGACSAIGRDVNALSWNPAGLARLDTAQATVAYTNLFQDVQLGFVGYARPAGKMQVVGLAVQSLSYGTFRETTLDDPTGGQHGTFGAADWAMTLSYSRRVGEHLSVGVNLTGLYERIQSYSAGAFAVDAGLQVRIPSRRLSLAAVLQHAGVGLSGFRPGRHDPLPLSVRAGLSYIPAHLPLLLTADVEQALDHTVAARLGGEFDIRGLVFLRGGYASTGSDQRVTPSDTRLAGFSTGIGVQARAYRLDYAYVPSLRLGDAHRVSLTRSLR